jgi:two-component system phosphate regulon sensor histidine kinase PhoR
MVIHELKAPLTAAQINLELIHEALRLGQPEVAASLATAAEQAVDRLVRLTDLLTEANRTEPVILAFQLLDLGHLVRQTSAWARPAAEAKRLRFRYDHPTAPLPVQGNADGIQSIVGNLLANAIRYTPKGGLVELTVGATKSGGSWLQVRDTGIGMTEETQAHIFEQFYRGAEARQFEATGLGLGLALVKRLVDAHNGTVQVTSAVGQGTTVRIELPAAPA